MGKDSSKTAPQKPAHEIRMGRIKAVIWANETEVGTRYGVTMFRLYKEGDEWKQSSSFNRDDLQLVAKVADRAHSWIFDQHGATEEAPAAEA